MPQVHQDVVWLKPGQIAERAGVAVSTLHYYESLGLIHSRRTAGNRREYRRDTLRVLAFVRASQRVGIGLERIKDALDQLPEKGLPTKKDWGAHLTRMEQRSGRADRVPHRSARPILQLHRLRMPLAEGPAHIPTRTTSLEPTGREHCGSHKVRQAGGARFSYSHTVIEMTISDGSCRGRGAHHQTAGR